MRTLWELGALQTWSLRTRKAVLVAGCLAVIRCHYLPHFPLFRVGDFWSQLTSTCPIPKSHLGQPAQLVTMEAVLGELPVSACWLVLRTCDQQRGEPCAGSPGLCVGRMHRVTPRFWAPRLASATPSWTFHSSITQLHRHINGNILSPDGQWRECLQGHLPKIIFLLSSSKIHSIHSCHF